VKNVVLPKSGTVLGSGVPVLTGTPEPFILGGGPGP
jgi:hypothetical protein